MAKKVKAPNQNIQNIAQLDSELARREGGKKVDSVGNIREVRRLLEDVIAEQPNVAVLMAANAKRRVRRSK